MNKLKISQAKIKIPTEPPAIDTPDWLPTKLHALVFAAAARGSGKTVAVSNMLRMYRDADLAHKILVLCPTKDSNKYLWEGMVDDEDWYIEPTHNTVRTILTKLEKLSDEWQQWKKHMDLYKRFHAAQDISDLTDDFLIECLEAGILDSDEPPTYFAGTAPLPCVHLVCDDVQSTEILHPSSKNVLLHLAILHRHFARRMGVSLYFLTQNMSGQSAGIPKAIRQNISCTLLWGCRDISQFQKMSDEFGLEIDADTLMQVYRYATQGSKHDFMCCDWSRGQFRKCFDEIIDVNAFKNNKAVKTDKKI